MKPRKGIKKYRSLRAQLANAKDLVNQMRETFKQCQHYEAFIFSCYTTNGTIEITHKNSSALKLCKFMGVQVIEFADHKSNIHVDSPALYFMKKQIDRDYEHDLMCKNHRMQSSRLERITHNSNGDTDNDSPFLNLSCS